jgi:hypothetical protein
VVRTAKRRHLEEAVGDQGGPERCAFVALSGPIGAIVEPAIWRLPGDRGKKLANVPEAE